MRTWEKVVEKFLKIYFPKSKTAKGKMEISSFHQFPDESLSEALDHFHRLLRKTPTHGYNELVQLNISKMACDHSQSNSLTHPQGEKSS